MKVSVKGVSKKFGKATALSGVNLEIREGSFMVLLGPSGSGKSTLLNILAGFEKPDRGDVCIDGADVTKIPANKRNIAMVFQKHSLFPDKTVRKNLSFPLDIRSDASVEFQEINDMAGITRAQIITTRIDEIARLLGISDLLSRMPHQLSGGQMQRVAIGKALIRKSTSILLMDEPFSNLDPMLRTQLRKELKSIARARNLTVIFVTHDQTEAEELADEIVILQHGKVLQMASPAFIYERPANLFIASFFGNPALNIIECYTDQDGHRVAIEKGESCHKKVKVGIRPNAVGVTPMQEPYIKLPFTVQAARSLNGHRLVEGLVGNDNFQVICHENEEQEIARACCVYVKRSDLLLFDVDSGDNLG